LLLKTIAPPPPNGLSDKIWHFLNTNNKDILAFFLNNQRREFEAVGTHHMTHNKNRFYEVHLQFGLHYSAASLSTERVKNNISENNYHLAASDIIKNVTSSDPKRQRVRCSAATTAEVVLFQGADVQRSHN
jgi:hypothetical protein